MKRRLADVYTKLFNFFREVISWYLKSKTSRFFASFNDSVNKKLKETVQAIQTCISDMYNEANIAGLAMQRATLSGMSQWSQNQDLRFAAIETSLKEVKYELNQQRSSLHFDFSSAMVHKFFSDSEKIVQGDGGRVSYSLSKL
jgi:hypothetical protein